MTDPKAIRSRFRNGSLDYSLKNGKLAKLTIRSKQGGNCRIRVYNPLKTTDNASLVVAKEPT